MKKTLEIKNLNFGFDKTSNLFFKNFCVEFESEKIHFIKGKNGIGKSVFLRILQGNILKNEVCFLEIFFEGEQFDCNSKINMVEQKFDLMIANQFSFKQNIQFANFSKYPLFSKLPDCGSLPKLLNKFQIDLEKPAFYLSGGQRQILAILMALQKKCKILLLDEPTSALDEYNADMVMKFLSELVEQSKITVLIICHDSELVEKYAKNGFYELDFNMQTGFRDLIYKKIV